jgi:acid phosphatase type 7
VIRPRSPARTLLTRAGLAALALAAACDEPEAPLLSRAAHEAIVAVRVRPGVAEVPYGDSQQLDADAEDTDGNTADAAPARWTSSDTTVVSMASDGVATARGFGWATVRAEVEGVVGTGVVEVLGGPRPASVTVVAAGDIAGCDSRGDEGTAALVGRIVGAGGATVAPLGDQAYPSGTASQFRDCYGPSWGAFRDRSRPAVGNHEYATASGAPYWDYFGPAAGARGEGWYSYDLGAWHVVVLNSNCDRVGCGRGSPQERWLRADLALHRAACTLAYWHHPRFNSGQTHGSDAAVGAFWDALYDHGVELVLDAHEHVYERFAPQTPAGRADPARGVRQITVGTGGKSLGRLGVRKANSERFDASVSGVLKLTLAEGSYAWAFVPVAPGAFRDSGTGTCH